MVFRKFLMVGLVLSALTISGCVGYGYYTHPYYYEYYGPDAYFLAPDGYYYFYDDDDFYPPFPPRHRFDDDDDDFRSPPRYRRNHGRPPINRPDRGDDGPTRLSPGLGDGGVRPDSSFGRGNGGAQPINPGRR